MITVNAIGDACPIPVVQTRNAMETIQGSEVWKRLWIMRSLWKT